MDLIKRIIRSIEGALLLSFKSILMTIVLGVPIATLSIPIVVLLLFAFASAEAIMLTILLPLIAAGLFDAFDKFMTGLALGFHGTDELLQEALSDGRTHTIVQIITKIIPIELINDKPYVAESIRKFVQIKYTGQMKPLAFFTDEKLRMHLDSSKEQARPLAIKYKELADRLAIIDASFTQSDEVGDFWDMTDEICWTDMVRPIALFKVWFDEQGSSHIVPDSTLITDLELFLKTIIKIPQNAKFREPIFSPRPFEGHPTEYRWSYYEQGTCPELASLARQLSELSQLVPPAPPFHTEPLFKQGQPNPSLVPTTPFGQHGL